MKIAILRHCFFDVGPSKFPVYWTFSSEKKTRKIFKKARICTLVLFVHSFTGFCRLRMHTKGGSPVAFVEFQDVRYAAQAMAALQGSLLLSSDRGPIRIEYAKSKMAEVGFTNLWIEVGFQL